MEFVSLISGPLGHPAALCFSRLAGLNRRPQSCRTKLRNDGFFGAASDTFPFYHAFYWEKIEHFRYQVKKATCFACLFFFNTCQGTPRNWTKNSGPTNLRNICSEPRKVSTAFQQRTPRSLGLRKWQFSRPNKHCQVLKPLRTPGLRTLCRDPVLNTQTDGFGHLTSKSPNTRQTSNNIPLQSTFWASNVMLFSPQSCSTSLWPLLASTFLRLWQQSLLSLRPRFC